MASFLIIIGILFAAYGILIALLNSGSYFFVIWFLLAAIFIFLSWSLKTGRLQQIHKSIKRIVIILVVIFLGSFIFCEMKIVQGFHMQGISELDYLVVLGAQIREDGPSPVLRWRLDRSIAYLEENPQTKVILSGGQGSNEPVSEAEGMRDYLRKNGIAEERMILEDQSKTTKENLLNSKHLIGENQSVGIVTNNFHVYRALLIAQDVGYENVVGISAKSNGLYLPNNILREYLALLKYYFQP